MKQKLLLAGMLIVLCFVFQGCSSGKLADEFSEETLENTAKDIISESLVQGVAATVDEHMRSDFLEDFPKEEIQDNLLSLQSGKGDFMFFQRVTIRGEKSPKENSEEDLAIVLVTATFEKGEILFYLTFDTEMNLVSFYVQ